MNVKYQVLASLALQHDYYTDGRCPDFRIVPSSGTQATLKNIGAVYKVTGNKLQVLIRTDEQDKAFIPVTDAHSFVFYLLAENPLFFNITNVTQQPASHRRYYFTNRPNYQPAGPVLYLNQVPEQYYDHNTYQVGDLVTDGSGHVAEAIKSSSWPDNVRLPGDPESWVFKTDTTASYVNKKDIVEFATAIYYYQLATPAKLFTIHISRYNADSSTTLVSTITPPEYDTDQTAISIPLNTLAPGYYKVEVNGQEKNIYLDPEAVYGRVFGIVELFGISGAGSLAMFNASGVLKHPEYVLRFPARSVVWKYLTNEELDHVSYGTYDFYYAADEKSGLNSYISNFPIPLVQQVASTSAPKKWFDEFHSEPLSVPAADKLTYVTYGMDTYFCIEKYLPYTKQINS